MKFLLVVILFLCVVSIHANFAIISQIPNTNTSILPSTRQFIFQSIEIKLIDIHKRDFVLVNQTVNQPQFQAFIHFYNATTNASISQIDVSSNTVNVTYLNDTLTFNTPQFNVNDQFYITFDAGVLFSNATVNSTAETDPNFWNLKVIDIQTSTSFTNTIGYTSIGTTQLVSTETSTAYSGTSGSTMIYTTVNQTTQNINTTSTVTTITVTAITGRKWHFFFHRMKQKIFL
jgi:hypothetical protein